MSSKREEEKRQDIKNKNLKESKKTSTNNITTKKPKSKNYSLKKTNKIDKKQNNFSGGIESFVNFTKNLSSDFNDETFLKYILFIKNFEFDDEFLNLERRLIIDFSQLYYLCHRVLCFPQLYGL